jgi:pyrimidine-nucleoside phosphorylase
MTGGMYEIISKKRDGAELDREEIAFVVAGSTSGEIPDEQLAAWLMSVYLRGMSDRETADLTAAMSASGGRIGLDGVAGPKIDKHSTGGVGDKISFVVAPLVAACGVRVPMLSGRGLGHTGGTLDKLESIPGLNVSLKPAEIRRVLAETGMVICGQTAELVPADRRLYALRDATATVGSIPLVASSIMSKKLALATDGIVLDVKTGSGATMRNERDALRLCRTMVDIGERAGRPTVGLITGMDQPLGRAVGNSLEIAESVEALRGRGPADILEVSFALGECMLRAAGQAAGRGEAAGMFREAIVSGRALDVFRRFIAAQGGDPGVCDDPSKLPAAARRTEFRASRSGVIEAIDALEVGLAAIDTGAGRRRQGDAVDPGAGFVFHAKTGDAVEAGRPIVTVHCDRGDRLPGVLERLAGAVRIGNGPVAAPALVRHIVDKNGVRPWTG